MRTLCCISSADCCFESGCIYETKQDKQQGGDRILQPIANQRYAHYLFVSGVEPPENKCSNTCYGSVRKMLKE